MYIYGKVNRTPFHDINVLFNRSLGKKLHSQIFRQQDHLKVECSDCVLIPQSSTGSSGSFILFYFFFGQMKANIFLITTQKFQLQIHSTWEILAENVPISGIPVFLFLWIFIIASSPVSHVFCSRRENKKQHWVELLVWGTVESRGISMIKATHLSRYLK